MGLAICAEVNVITDRTLVTNTGDVALCGLVLAHGSIAEDAIVDLVKTGLVTERIINRRESVTGMVDWGLGMTLGAEVPIWAGQALVAGANNALYFQSVKLNACVR